MVRLAQTRDIPRVAELLRALVDYHRDRGDDPFCRDENGLVGGILEYIVERMRREGHILLVLEEEGAVTGFLSGSIGLHHKFYEHRVLGEIEYLYPLSFAVSSLVAEFDEWARGRGATARAMYTMPRNHRAQRIYERRGAVPMLTKFICTYGGRD